MKTRLTALAAAVSSLSMLTACGGGGGEASGETPTYTPPAVTYYSSSEGLWTGTVGSRTVSGVVTDQYAYWFVYNESGGPAPAGFYVGSAGDDKGSGSVDGSQGAINSAVVLRFDFEGDTVVRDGKLAATYPRTSITTTDKTASPYLDTNTLNGNFLALVGGTTFNVEMNASNYFPGANGYLNMDGFTGVWDSVSGQGSWTGTTTVVAFNAIMHYTQTFTMNVTAIGTGPKQVAGAGGLNALDLATCTDNDLQPGTSCNGFSAPLSGTWRNTAVNPADKNTYKIPVPFTPSDGWTGSWTLSTQKILQDGTVEYNPVPMTVTLHARPLTNSISNAVLTTTYNKLYHEEKPLMSRVAGTYTSGWTGIAAARYADASLTINAQDLSTPDRPFDGSFAGTESATFCNYSGSMTPHVKKGNLYDVYDLVFTSAAGGTCPYAGITFSGVATYDAGKLTLTATNSTKDKGFMVVALKP